VRHLLLTLLVGLAALVHPAGADGPWRGQVVDAETGRPLAGVVVLAFWTRSTPSLGGWAATEYHASEEVVTGPDGRFLIGSRWSYTIPLVVKVQGPEWRVFKPGYGAWRYPHEDAVDHFSRGQETELRLEPLTTKEARVAFMRAMSVPVHVPVEKRTRLMDALNIERLHLGLGGDLK